MRFALFALCLAGAAGASSVAYALSCDVAAHEEVLELRLVEVFVDGALESEPVPGVPAIGSEAALQAFAYDSSLYLYGEPFTALEASDLLACSLASGS